ncbi:MAG TPA: hypothetical protein VFV70_02000 [Hyphomonadaceae bacterium]|nr:hypothetical protein [Hyphomonadaceae bacterium]
MSDDTPPWEDEVPPLALTEAHLPALAAAIHSEGYRIMVDTETGEVRLERRMSFYGGGSGARGSGEGGAG